MMKSMEHTTSPDILPSCHTKLVRLLESAGIDTALYTGRDTKTVADLAREIEAGESVVTLSHQGDVERIVHVVGIDVLYHHPDGRILILEETQQIKSTGEVLVRQLDTSIGEKRAATEDPTVAALRGLQEELGISEPESLYFAGYHEVQRASTSYPGVISSQRMHTYAAVIGNADYNPEGYEEHQSDKTTYFAWRTLQDSTTATQT